MNFNQIFKRIYDSESRRLRPDRKRRQELKLQLGFGFSWKVWFQSLLRPVFLAPVGAMAVLAIVAVSFFSPQTIERTTLKVAGVFDFGRDDWQYAPTKNDGGWSMPIGLSGSSTSGPNLGVGYSASIGLGAAPSASAPNAKMGFAVGGAKDVTTFRNNIKNGYLPKTTAITPEGLFYEYFFDTATGQECSDLFCPTYLRAVSADPLSGQEDRYLAVGLGSGMNAADFVRKPLDLVVVLDISDSMSSDMIGYYYDQDHSVIDEIAPATSKMTAAKEAIVALTGHLKNDDGFGVVLFNDASSLAKPLSRIGETDMSAIKAHILEIGPSGSTNLDAGMNEAYALFATAESDAAREKRIIVLTDAMPNQDRVGQNDFIGLMTDQAEKGVYTTFIGIGLDFQTDLVENITKVRGANYYSVGTVKEFTDRMDKGFDNMVSPLVFDLKLTVSAPGYQIEEVYGSPEADMATGELMKVNTLFPTETDERGARGGIIIMKMKKIGDDPKVTLTAEYLDRDLKPFSNSSDASFENITVGAYDNLGVRKGVLLARYADLLRHWVAFEQGKMHSNGGEVDLPVDEISGIRPFPEIFESSPLSQWEKGSVKLTVSPEYVENFQKFRDHFQSEMETIGDNDLQQEIDLMNLLIPPVM